MPTARAVRHHLALVVVAVLLGAVAGWAYAGTMTTSYTSTARVLVDPAVGNPFVPTPTAVRQDELTSLETEAQVAGSAEVLASVARQAPPWTTAGLARGLLVTVPPNSQVLEISFTATDPAVARRIAGLTADAYLANRARRSDAVNAARVHRVVTQTSSVVTDLRAATAAAQQGTPAERLFQTQLATALRNELVNLRAQRTALENSDSPVGAVITPAGVAQDATSLVALGLPVGGGLAGLLVGCLLALALERFRGVVRSPAEVAELGLPVAAAVPQPSPWARVLRREDPEAFGDTVRRLRAAVLEQDPRPDIVAVASCDGDRPRSEVCEAVAESFARAGHRVVLVRTDGPPIGGGLVAQEGLAQALEYDRLDVLELLLPSVEPLLCLLPSGGFTAQQRELMVAARLRAVLRPLVEAGNLVVVESPTVHRAEGEAVLAAADLGLVVVVAGRTRRADVARAARVRGGSLGALLVGRGRASLPDHPAPVDGDPAARTRTAVPQQQLTRRHR
ncbi:MAG: Wzz/FepE/Etk N-terminal domain-containing protein [Nocardioides sp.]